MKITSLLFTLVLLCAIPAFGQTPDARPASDADFKIALPIHPGQLSWRADGFKIVELSAKSKGQEIGLRGTNDSDRLTFLGFLFLVPEQAPLTSEKCRAGILEEQKKNPTLKMLMTAEEKSSGTIPVAIATYSTHGKNGKTWYSVRGFVAEGDICGDLEIYSQDAINADDPELNKIFGSYQLDPGYVPVFNDMLLYAQILYRHQMYKAAGPIFEAALAKLGDDPAQQTMRRATTDQAGMSYGIAGDIPKARAIFVSAIAKDPDYPLYYYNLACADAEEKKLGDARVHLQQAFARKQNMIPGETFPDPTKDGSFLPYKNDKDFWTFVEQLH
ncbi:MAG: tetratricopeptide repeat protein [Candidatus Acidiferrales bacterium]